MVEAARKQSREDTGDTRTGAGAVALGVGNSHLFQASWTGTRDTNPRQSTCSDIRVACSPRCAVSARAPLAIRGTCMKAVKTRTAQHRPLVYPSSTPHRFVLTRSHNVRPPAVHRQLLKARLAAPFPAPRTTCNLDPCHPLPPFTIIGSRSPPLLLRPAHRAHEQHPKSTHLRRRYIVRCPLRRASIDNLPALPPKHSSCRCNRAFASATTAISITPPRLLDSRRCRAATLPLLRSRFSRLRVEARRGNEPRARDQRANAPVVVVFPGANVTLFRCHCRARASGTPLRSEPPG